MATHHEDIRPAHMDAGEVVTIGHEAAQRMSKANPNMANIRDQAQRSSEKEHVMGLWQALKLYPKAVGWSLLLSTAIIMEGYDTALLGSFYGFPAFAKKYGVPQPDGTYQVTAPWQSGLSNGVFVGEILGLTITGIVSEKYGYRKTMIGSLFMVICFIFIPFFAQNVQTLEAGEILCGVPWGVFQTLTTAYAADVCPMVLRAYLTSYVNLCWVIGQFIAQGVLRATLGRTDQWAYRIPFAIQWIWPIPLIIGCYFAPESPWWLVRQGRLEQAKQSLCRLTTEKDSTFDPDETVALMVYTTELERELSAGASYFDCFKGIDLRRTEIVCVVWVVQSLCGSAFMAYSTYFYEQAGLPVTDAFDMSMGQYALGAVGTVLSWFLMRGFGRRTLWIGGLVTMFTLLLVIGAVGTRPSTDQSASWAIGTMLLIYTFVYDSTIGPLEYALVAEIPSTRLRNKTMVLGRNMNDLFNIVDGVMTPYMLNPTAWAWGAKAGFFWAGCCFLCLLWSVSVCPNPRAALTRSWTSYSRAGYLLGDSPKRWSTPSKWTMSKLWILRRVCPPRHSLETSRRECLSAEGDLPAFRVLHLRSWIIHRTITPVGQLGGDRSTDQDRCIHRDCCCQYRSTSSWVG